MNRTNKNYFEETNINWMEWEYDEIETILD